jgi:anti-sigma regulatory factor (Ser/Thr protein kinase)
MAMSSTSPVARFGMVSEPGDLPRMREWLRERLRPSGLTASASAAVVIAVGELCTNAILHAYAGQKGQPIELSVGIGEDHVEVTVEDFGRPFDRSEYRRPDSTELPDHGWGLFLVHRLVDSCRVDTDRPRGTRWTVVKYCPRATARPRDASIRPCG